MSQKINTIIIEDDQETLTYINDIIANELVDLKVIATCTSVAESKKSITEQQPELIVMDIKLQDGTAFDILDTFPNPNFEVIFVTGHSGYLERAFEYFAFSYLSKPIDKTLLVKIIKQYILKKERRYMAFKMDILRDFISDAGTKFLLHTGTDHLAIDLKDILYCKADGNYTLFYSENEKKVMASNALKHYEKLLLPKGFFRINRFHLINLSHIKSIHKRESIILTDSTVINLAARNKTKLTDLIERFNAHVSLK